MLDSLQDIRRSSVSQALRDYLACEYVAKFGKKKIFSKGTIKSTYLRIPGQLNKTDCGLYLLQYVESFFKVSFKISYKFF